MAKSTPVAKRGTRTKTRKRRQRVRLGRFAPLVVAIVVAYLYYRPLANWFAMRHTLAQSTAQVRTLSAQKAALEREVEQATSLVQLERSARQIGLVRPGERLFIVKGVRDWLHTHPQAR